MLDDEGDEIPVPSIVVKRELERMRRADRANERQLAKLAVYMLLNRPRTPRA